MSELLQPSPMNRGRFPAPLESGDSTTTLLDQLLQEQQLFTPVARFSREHGTLPAQARYYSQLLPLDRPRPGQQYAFGVDLDVCTGCKACVSACHSLNGLDEDEIWRTVGLIHGDDDSGPYQQTVTTACHHCADPACLNGCPVKAYEKDAETGIVRHLDDQCIGCQYCVLKCPYDVPKYSKKRGIVRKCDMCYNRLAVNEAPACVQACPNGAITIRLVEIPSLPAQSRLVPDAFPSDYTRPSTAYTTRKSIPLNARAADAHSLRLEHAHFPLVFMLVLTQLAAGLFIALALIQFFQLQLPSAPWALAGFASLNLGLALSVLHLGRPLKAWRAFLGLKTSWMSREILIFSVFAGSVGLATTASLWPALRPWIPGPFSALDLGAWLSPISLLTAVLGLLGVFTSAMIYIDTRRPPWAAPRTFAKFFTTVVLLGATGSACLMSLSNGPLPGRFALGLPILMLGLWGWDLIASRRALKSPEHPAHFMAKTIQLLMAPWFRAQITLCCAAIGLATLAISLRSSGQGICLALVFVLALLSQLLERTFYFAACPAPRMPGGFHP